MIYHQLAPKILNAFASAKFPLIISHEKPDGDTLGASLALSHFFIREKKDYLHFCPEKSPGYFSFLPKIENLITDFQQIDLKKHDLIITVDCAQLQRTGIAEDLLVIKQTVPFINIDHHQSNDNYGNYNLVIPTASSTSEIVYNFFNFNSIEIDKYMATSLLTGILTDTMNFTNAATTKESLEIAAVLLNKGARINQIINSLSQTRSLLALKLWGLVFSQLQFNEEHNFVYTIITQADLQEHQTTADEVRDGLANFLSAIPDVDFILILTEQEKEFIKGSLRTTKDTINVAEIAGLFGGGGHQKAAGFKLEKKSIDQSIGWKNFILNAIITKLKLKPKI